jgi:hypothetical protein
MKLFKYNIQYNKYKEGKEITIKESILSIDNKEAVLNELIITGKRNPKVTRTKEIS